jgi:NADH-quinone oxidoreductase subunit K
VIHLAGPYVVAALLVGLGVMGVLVRRNAVLLLIGVELILSGSLVLLVASGATAPSRWEASSILPLFVITIAAAEVVVALAVILTAFRLRGSIDLDEPLDERLIASSSGPAAAGTGNKSGGGGE